MADDHQAWLAALYDGLTALFQLGGNEGDSSALTRFEYTEPFARVLRDGIADGTWKSEDPDEDAELIFNTAGWIYVHFRRSHGWTARRARGGRPHRYRLLLRRPGVGYFPSANTDTMRET